MPGYLRAFRADDQTPDDGPLRFVASTEGVKRDGQDLSLNQWDLTNYKRNNLFLWAHSYGSPFGGPPLLPIGRADVTVDAKNKRLLADVTFDPNDEFAQTVRSKYVNRFLNAVSVGWDVVLPPGKAFHEVNKDDVRLDLLDLSAVPIPGDPDALMERQKRAYEDMGRELLKLADAEPDDDTTRAATDRQHRGAIPANTGGPKADEDASWDGPGEVAKADAERDVLRRMHAWVDGDGDPDTKSSYKFPHHRADGTLVFKALVAAYGRLDQANIPDADKDGVARHLAAHYREFDKEPPERSAEPPPARATWDETAAAMVRVFRPFAQRPDADREADYRRLARDYGRHKKTAPEFQTNAQLEALGADELRGLFLEGEPELFPDEFAWFDTRAGAALNARNRERLEQAATLIGDVLSSVKKQADDDEERAALDAAQRLRDLLGVPA